MATQLVTFKMNHAALEEVDEIAKAGYYSRTEFIRAALRDKVEEARYRKALAEIAPFKGIIKRKTTEKEYETARDAAAKQIAKKLGIKLE